MEFAQVKGKEGGIQAVETARIKGQSRYEHVTVDLRCRQLKIDLARGEYEGWKVERGNRGPQKPGKGA